MNQFVKTLIVEIFLKQPIFWIFIILGFFSAIFYKKIVGFLGEFFVKTELNKLAKENYQILNNIMINSSKGTNQIDHIVISKYGIFVIETKNYAGLITGNEYKNKWTQHLGKNKYYFHNPIHQNYGHIKALEEILNLKEDKFISIICMTNQAKIKVNANNVTNINNIVNLIQSYNNEILDINLLNEFKSKLKNLNIIDKKTRKKHVKAIKKNIKINEIKESNMICPKCGGTLVERNGKYGKFIGCSNYPECKYTKH